MIVSICRYEQLTRLYPDLSDYKLYQAQSLYKVSGLHYCQIAVLSVSTLHSIKTLKCPMLLNYLKTFCLVMLRGLAHLAALTLVSVVLHYVTFKTVASVGLTGMQTTGCSG